MKEIVYAFLGADVIGIALFLVAVYLKNKALSRKLIFVSKLLVATATTPLVGLGISSGLLPSFGIKTGIGVLISMFIAIGLCAYWILDFTKDTVTASVATFFAACAIVYLTLFLEVNTYGE